MFTFQSRLFFLVLALFLSINSVSKCQVSLDKGIIFTGDEFFEAFKTEFESSYIKIADDTVSIYPQGNIINNFPEFFLSSLASLFLYEAYITPYESIKAGDFFTKKIETPKKISMIAYGLALIVIVTVFLYEKFGFDGPVLEFDKIGLRYKKKRKFTWSELNDFKVKKLSSYFPINILNCYGKEDVKLLSLDRKFIALPDELTIDSLQQLMNYFFSKYRNKLYRI